MLCGRSCYATLFRARHNILLEVNRGKFRTVNLEVGCLVRDELSAKKIEKELFMSYILVVSGSLKAIVKNGKDSVLRMAIDTYDGIRSKRFGPESSLDSSKGKCLDGISFRTRLKLICFHFTTPC
jgi:hypothetical protein